MKPYNSQSGKSVCFRQRNERCRSTSGYHVQPIDFIDAKREICRLDILSTNTYHRAVRDLRKGYILTQDEMRTTLQSSERT